MLTGLSQETQSLLAGSTHFEVINLKERLKDALKSARFFSDKTKLGCSVW